MKPHALTCLSDENTPLTCLCFFNISLFFDGLCVGAVEFTLYSMDKFQQDVNFIHSYIMVQ